MPGKQSDSIGTNDIVVASSLLERLLNEVGNSFSIISHQTWLDRTNCLLDLINRGVDTVPVAEHYREQLLKFADLSSEDFEKRQDAEDYFVKGGIRSIQFLFWIHVQAQELKQLATAKDPDKEEKIAALLTKIGIDPKHWKQVQDSGSSLTGLETARALYCLALRDLNAEMPPDPEVDRRLKTIYQKIIVPESFKFPQEFSQLFSAKERQLLGLLVDPQTPLTDVQAIEQLRSTVSKLAVTNDGKMILNGFDDKMLEQYELTLTKISEKHSHDQRAVNQQLGMIKLLRALKARASKGPDRMGPTLRERGAEVRDEKQNQLGAQESGQTTARSLERLIADVDAMAARNVQQVGDILDRVMSGAETQGDRKPQSDGEGGTVEQRQAEYKRLLDFAKNAGMAAVRDTPDYLAACNLGPQQRLAEYSAEMNRPVQFADKDHHKLVDTLVAHYDKATSDSEKQEALQQLGVQAQLGNLSAVPAKLALSAQYAATRIVASQLVLENASATPEERAKAERQRAESLRDLVALSTLADSSGDNARALIAGLRTGPVKGLAKEAIDKARKEWEEAIKAENRLDGHKLAQSPAQESALSLELSAIPPNMQERTLAGIQSDQKATENLSRILESNPELLPMARKDAEELRERMIVEADRAIGRFLRREHPSDELLSDLVGTMRLNRDGSLGAHGLSESVTSRLKSHWQEFAPAVQPLIAKLLNPPYKLSVEEVEALRTGSQQTEMQRNQALEDLSKLGLERLGRFGTGMEDSVANLRAICAVQTLHRTLDRALQVFKSDSGNVADPEKVLSEVRGAFKVFEQLPPCELARRFRTALKDKERRRLQELTGERPLATAVALKELQRALPNGHAELNECRALRIVRGLSEQSTAADFAAASQALQAEIAAEQKLGRTENKPAKQWLEWADSSAALKEVNDGLSGNNKAQVLEGIRKLEKMVQNDNDQARLRLFLVLQGLTEPAWHETWVAQAEETSGRPVYSLHVGGLDSAGRKEVAKAVLVAIDSHVAADALDATSAHALALAIGKMDQDDARSIVAMLERGLRGTGREQVLTGILNGIGDDGTGTAALATVFVKGHQLNNFAPAIREVHNLACEGNPAAMRILSALACGCVDRLDLNLSSNWSQAAAETMRAVGANPVRAKEAMVALLEMGERRRSDSDYMRGHVLLTVIGETAAFFSCESSDSVEQKLVDRARSLLRREYEESSADKSSDRYKQAVTGLLLMAKHLNKEESRSLAEDLSPVCLEQLRLHGADLSIEAKRELVGMLVSMAGEGIRVPHSGWIDHDSRKKDFQALAAVVDGITAQELEETVYGSLQKTPTETEWKVRSVVPTREATDAERKRIAEEKQELQDLMRLVTVKALANSGKEDVRRLAAEILTTVITPRDLSPDDRKALVAVFRDGVGMDSEVARRVGKICREYEIPAPIEILISDLGVPVDARLREIADMIRAKYRSGELVLRRALANAQAANLLTGHERAQLLGWDKLGKSEKVRLGWFDSPPEPLLWQLGMNKLKDEQRVAINKVIDGARREGKRIEEVLSAELKAELSSCGLSAWEELSAEKKEEMRWYHADRINPLQLLGQMANGIADETSNAALLRPELTNALSALHQQSIYSLQDSGYSIRQLETEAQDKLTELARLTKRGPDSVIGKLFSAWYAAHSGMQSGTVGLVTGQGFSGFSTMLHALPPLDEVKNRLLADGVDPALADKQLKLLQEVQQLTDRLANVRLKHLEHSEAERRLALAIGVREQRWLRDSGRREEADKQALRLWKEHGPRVANIPEIAEGLNGKPNEAGALARLKDAGSGAWEKLPNYSTAGLQDRAESAAKHVFDDHVDVSFQAYYRQAVANGAGREFILEVNRVLQNRGVTWRVREEGDARLTNQCHIFVADLSNKTLFEAKFGLGEQSEEQRSYAAREAWKGALGLKPVTVEPLGALQRSGTIKPEHRGLMQIDRRSFPDYELREALVANAFQTLDNDAVFRKVQHVSGELAEPLARMSQLFQSGMSGTPYHHFVQEAQRLAREVDGIMAKVSPEELEQLRFRVQDMEMALHEMTKNSRDAERTDPRCRELKKRIDNLKKVHDMLCSGPERLEFEQIKDESGNPLRDPNTNEPMYRYSYRDIRKIIEGIQSEGLRPATISNWLKANGPIIGATIVAMAGTAAACATLGVTSPAAVAAWMAVGALIAREGTREALYHLNSQGYTGIGIYGDTGADIMNWYRYCDRFTPGESAQALGWVGLKYIGEVTKDTLAMVLTGAVVSKVFNGQTFGEALAAQFRAAPNPLHLAFKCERTLLQLEGSALAASYFREFMLHFGEHCGMLSGFAGAHTLISATIDGPELHAFYAQSGWLGHEILDWGLTTSLAAGQGFVSAIRTGKRGQFHYELKPEMSREAFLDFLRKEGYIVTQSKTDPNSWEALPITAGRNAKPITLVEDRPAEQRAVVGPGAANERLSGVENRPATKKVPLHENSAAIEQIGRTIQEATHDWTDLSNHYQKARRYFEAEAKLREEVHKRADKLQNESSGMGKQEAINRALTEAREGSGSLRQLHDQAVDLRAQDEQSIEYVESRQRMLQALVNRVCRLQGIPPVAVEIMPELGRPGQYTLGQGTVQIRIKDGLNSQGGQRLVGLVAHELSHHQQDVQIIRSIAQELGIPNGEPIDQQHLRQLQTEYSRRMAGTQLSERMARQCVETPYERLSEGQLAESRALAESFRAMLEGRAGPDSLHEVRARQAERLGEDWLRQHATERKPRVADKEPEARSREQRSQEERAADRERIRNKLRERMRLQNPLDRSNVGADPAETAFEIFTDGRLGGLADRLGVLADYLEDCGQVERAQIVRGRAELARLSSEVPRAEHERMANRAREAELVRDLVARSREFLRRREKDLSYLCFAGENLSVHAVLAEGVNLRGADLRQANLSRLQINNADLRAVNLRRANFIGVRLSNSNVSGANFTNADLTSAVIQNSNLSRSTFEGTTLTSVRMQGLNLSDSIFLNVDMAGFMGQQLNLRRSKWRGVNNMTRVGGTDAAPSLLGRPLEISQADFTESQFYGIDRDFRSFGNRMPTGAGLRLGQLTDVIMDRVVVRPAH